MKDQSQAWLKERKRQWWTLYSPCMWLRNALRNANHREKKEDLLAPIFSKSMLKSFIRWRKKKKKPLFFQNMIKPAWYTVLPCFLWSYSEKSKEVKNRPYFRSVILWEQPKLFTPSDLKWSKTKYSVRHVQNEKGAIKLHAYSKYHQLIGTNRQRKIIKIKNSDRRSQTDLLSPLYLCVGICCKGSKQKAWASEHACTLAKF